jgi:hypothetical protein
VSVPSRTESSAELQVNIWTGGVGAGATNSLGARSAQMMYPLVRDFAAEGIPCGGDPPGAGLQQAGLPCVEPESGQPPGLDKVHLIHNVAAAKQCRESRRRIRPSHHCVEYSVRSSRTAVAMIRAASASHCGPGWAYSSNTAEFVWVRWMFASSLPIERSSAR